MFWKCLKYDLKAYRKVWLISSAAILLIMLISGVGLGGLITAAAETNALPQESQEEFLQLIWTIARFLLGIFSYIAVIYAVIIYGAANGILRLVHYYTKFFTDQGYLTFTLPVKRSTQFWSKVTAHLLYFLGMGAVYAVGFGTLILGIGSCLLLSPFTRENTLANLGGIFQGLQFSTVLYVIVLVILLAVLLVAVLFAALMLDYLVVTLAATLFRRLKILSVLVAYYVINNILLVPVIYIGVYYMMFAAMFGAMGFIALFNVPIIGWLGIYALILLLALAFVTVGLVLSNFTVWRLERKINLA